VRARIQSRHEIACSNEFRPFFLIAAVNTFEDNKKRKKQK
jgi:hypothetical protein